MTKRDSRKLYGRTPQLQQEPPEVAAFRAEARKKELAFTENFLWITTKKAGSEGMQKLKLNWSQRRVEEEIAAIEAERKPVRIAVCKSRQVGISTGVSARDFRKAYLNNNTNVVVMAHLDSVTKNLFNMHHRFLNNLPSDAQLAIKRSNVSEMVWQVINSQIIVRTAGSKHSFRSFTPHHLHGSETAFMQDFPGVRQSVETAVPMTEGSSVLYESTSYGAGTDWHKFYKAAEAGDIYFRALFLEWFKDPQCQAPPFESEEIQDACLSDLFFKFPELKDRMEHFKLTPRQIYFYGFQLINTYGGDTIRMMQEYPCTADESFLASGTPIFPMATIEKYKNASYAGKRYELSNAIENLEQAIRNTDLTHGKHNYFEIFKPPIPGRQYLIAADVSRGMEDSDYQGACIFDIGSISLVGIIHGRVDMKYYSQVLRRLGRIYNNALLMPEVTGLGAGLLPLLTEDYWRIYQQRKESEFTVELTHKLGWETTNTSKLNMVSTARQVFVERSHYKPEEHMPCRAVAQELSTFVQDNLNKSGGSKGCHDDLAVAYCMGVKGCLDEIKINPSLVQTQTVIDPFKDEQLILTPKDIIKAWKKYVPGYDISQTLDFGPYKYKEDDDE